MTGERICNLVFICGKPSRSGVNEIPEDRLYCEIWSSLWMCSVSGNSSVPWKTILIQGVIQLLYIRSGEMWADGEGLPYSPTLYLNEVCVVLESITLTMALKPKDPKQLGYLAYSFTAVRRAKKARLCGKTLGKRYTLSNSLSSFTPIWILMCL